MFHYQLKFEIMEGLVESRSLLFSALTGSSVIIGFYRGINVRKICIKTASCVIVKQNNNGWRFFTHKLVIPYNFLSCKNVLFTYRDHWLNAEVSFIKMFHCNIV